MIAPISPAVKTNNTSYTPQQIPLNNSIDPSVSDDLQKAKAMLYQGTSGRIDPRALNLINMAETAVKNGNSFAAKNFAGKAVKMLAPKAMPDLKPEVLEPKPVKKNIEKNRPEKKAETSTHMYQDASGDAGVSFTYPAPLTAAQSFIAVPAHEAQHVGRRISEAVLNGDRVLVYVTYKVRYDPNTGEAYMAGGVTRSITYSHKDKADAFCGSNIDLYI